MSSREILKTLCFLWMCSSVYSDKVTIEVLKNVTHCIERDFETCLEDYMARALIEASNINGISSFNNGSRSIDDLEDVLLNQLAAATGLGADSELAGSSRGLTRTFQKAWKFIIPLLIGVKLKLSVFIPLVLVALTLMAKTAVFSSNAALFFTILNLVLKYYYPKWTQDSHHSPHQQGNFNEGYGDIAGQFSNSLHGQYGQQQQQPYGHQDVSNFLQPLHKRIYYD